MSESFDISNKGRFIVCGTMLRNEPEQLVVVMAGMVVLRVEFDLSRDRAEYVAIGPMFDSVVFGTEIPLYDCMMTRDEFGTITVVEWRKAS